MEELKIHERFEMETLESMRSTKALEKLVFTGDTMLRLCFRLPRYSVDLDFYVRRRMDFKSDFIRLKEVFVERGCELTDFHEKHFSYLIELRRGGYPRRLKIEIRKERGGEQEITSSIAFTPSAPELQVQLKTCTLKQMWFNKVKALLDRGEIRDAFDLEFILKRERSCMDTMTSDEAKRALGVLDDFVETDYRNTLGNLLTPEDRIFYTENRFAYLNSELKALI